LNLPGQVYQKRIERPHGDIPEVRGRLGGHVHPLVDAEERAASLVRRRRDGHHYLVEDARRALDDVEVAVGHRVERAGADCSLHSTLPSP
jgi:hypothetical protein